MFKKKEYDNTQMISDCVGSLNIVLWGFKNFGLEKTLELLNKCKIDESYNFLSLMAVTPGRSFCVHGGIPQEIDDLMELDRITKPYFELTLGKNQTANMEVVDKKIHTSKTIPSKSSSSSSLSGRSSRRRA